MGIKGSSLVAYSCLSNSIGNPTGLNSDNIRSLEYLNGFNVSEAMLSESGVSKLPEESEVDEGPLSDRALVAATDE